MGGFGSLVMHELARRGAFDRGLAIRNVCLPDRIIEQASPAEMYEDAGMTAADIAAAIRQVAVVPGAGRVVPLRGA